MPFLTDPLTDPFAPPRGLKYIDPVPLVDPRDSPPPKELASLHFNDVYLAYRRAPRSNRINTPVNKSLRVAPLSANLEFLLVNLIQICRLQNCSQLLNRCIRVPFVLLASKNEFVHALRIGISPSRDFSTASCLQPCDFL